MDPIYPPGSGQPSGFSENKVPEDSKPPSSRRASSKQSVENDQLGFEGGIGAGEPGSNLLQVPVTSVSRSGAPRWATRIFLVIEVIIWIELGMILVVVPWTHAWSDNGLILNYPRIRELLSINFVRGVVTGIGLLDIWAGVSQAIHYQDPVGTK
jgi:hypothetical protein